jgi:hypothetical protein
MVNAKRLARQVPNLDIELLVTVLDRAIAGAALIGEYTE